jgi:hypothetical protein
MHPQFLSPEMEVLDRAYRITLPAKAVCVLEQLTGIPSTTPVRMHNSNITPLGFNPALWYTVGNYFVRGRLRRYAKEIPQGWKWDLPHRFETLCSLADPEDLPWLLARFGELPSESRPLALRMLGASFGSDEKVIALLASLSLGAGSERLAALDGRARAGDASVRESLLSILKEGASNERAEAAIALAFLKEEQVLPVLGSLLAGTGSEDHERKPIDHPVERADERDILRLRILEALGRFEREKVIEVLLPEKGNFFIAGLLAFLGDREGEEVLVKALEDPETRLRAARPLLRFGRGPGYERARAHLPELVREAVERGCGALVASGKKGREGLNPAMQHFAAFVLKRCGKVEEARGLLEQAPEGGQKWQKWKVAAQAVVFEALAYLEVGEGEEDLEAAGEAIGMLLKEIRSDQKRNYVSPYGASCPWPFSDFYCLALVRYWLSEGYEEDVLPPVVWEEMGHHIGSVQRPDGTWRYNYSHSSNAGNHTPAGGVVMALTAAARGSPPKDKERFAKLLRKMREEEPVRKALEWLDRNYLIGGNPQGNSEFVALAYQFLFASGQIASMCERETLAGIDWRQKGDEYLVLTQRSEGNWMVLGPDTAYGFDTGLALLFLKRDFLIPWER